MFFDHASVAVLEKHVEINIVAMIAYYTLRAVARISFPIFCFFIVEGFMHTRSKWKYALRLFTFALLSEIPFDSSLFGKLIFTGYQNAYFTLLFGMICIWIIDTIGKHVPRKSFFYIAGSIVVTSLFSGAAYFLRTDYGYKGVVAITLLYILRPYRWSAILSSCAVLCINNLAEAPCFLVYPLLRFYNGERGKGLKYLFYIFYPAHLALLAFARYLL